MIKDILEIEEQLSRIITKDKKSWVEMYQLIKMVDEGKLWQQGNHPNFTSWVRYLAQKNKVHETLIWKRKKAGEIYEGYVDRKATKNELAPILENLKVSPDNFELIEKISLRNDDTKDDLIDKVINGELTRKDLQSAWQSVKALRASSGGTAIRTSRHNEIARSDNGFNATDIALSLATKKWIKDFSDHYNDRSTSREKRVYRTLGEFPVYTASTRNSRRIDLLIIENISLNESYKVNLHGIEIKVSKNDLLNDKKMSEYTEFVDFFWLAVPEVLLEEALTVLQPRWGLLLIDSKNTIVVKKKAVRSTALRREAALQTALLKLS